MLTHYHSTLMYIWDEAHVLCVATGVPILTNFPVLKSFLHNSSMCEHTTVDSGKREGLEPYIILAIKRGTHKKGYNHDF